MIVKLSTITRILKNAGLRKSDGRMSSGSMLTSYTDRNYGYRIKNIGMAGYWRVDARYPRDRRPDEEGKIMTALSAAGIKSELQIDTNKLSFIKVYKDQTPATEQAAADLADDMNTDGY